MNRLFFKIFLGFWLTTILMLLAVHLVSQVLHREERPGHPPPWKLHSEVALVLEMGQRQIQSQDAQALARWLAALPQHDTVLPQLFTLDNTPLSQLSGSLESAALSAVAADISESNPRILQDIDDKRVIGHLLTKNDTPAAKLLVEIPRPPSTLVMVLQRYLWLRLLIALVVSGLVCYLLAAQAVRPILRLRSATQGLAAGRLDTRIPMNTQSSDEVLALSRDFNHMADRLQHTIEDQKQLVRDISHELRSPLGRIQAALALAQARLGSDPPELAQVQRECERLNELIAQLLVVPDNPLDLEDTVDIIELMHSIVEENTVAAQPRQIQLRVQSTQPELLLRCNGELLYRAVDNVVRNAIRHAPNDSRITLDCQCDSDDLRIDIRDQGQGIPDHELDKIFLPFYRVQSARERDTGGYGLGLSIAQRAVASHGGRISARNLHPGFAVTLHLPLRLVQTEPSTA